MSHRCYSTTTMLSWAWSLLSLLFVLLPVSLGHTQTSATMGAHPGPLPILDTLAQEEETSKKRQVSSLLSEAAAGGRGGAPLPVILELAVKPAVGATALAKSRQQSALQRVQERVLADLSMAKSAQGVKVFAVLPLLALPLDVAQLKRAAAHGDVVAIHPDRLMQPTLAESTALTGATTVWGQGATGSGQVVAILDTGVDNDHPFLAGKVVAEACFSTTLPSQGASSVCPDGSEQQIGPGAGNHCPLDVVGCNHGTHVAGIAAGEGSSFSGMARGADLMAIQVFSRFPRSVCEQYGYASDCVFTYTSDQILGLEYVYSQRNNFAIASANMSLGGGQFFTACDNEPQKPIMDLLRGIGIATVVASGNNGFRDSLSSPACISTAISVGSTTKTDLVSGFSNVAAFLDLVAPGSSIRSSVPETGFAFFNGTSMAAPHVAGSFAILRASQPGASVDAMLSTLRNTGVAIADDQRAGSLGITKPRIQVDAAVADLGAGGASLGVTPTDGLAASGPVGGPFTPNSASFVIINTGDSGLSWQASEDALWAVASPASGQLAPGEEATVTISIDGNVAASLAADTYSNTLRFNNTTNGRGDTARSLSLTVRLPPAVNDKFQDAIVLDGSSGSTSGGNQGTGKASGEPAHGGRPGGASVWWRWQAPGAGRLSVDTVGSNFDTLLGVYTGERVDALTTVAGNDDGDGIGLLSRVSFDTSAGAVYYLAVDGYAAATGDIQLNWEYTPDQTPPGELSVTPNEGFAASGPVGGPFIPASESYTLSNIGGSTIDWVVQESVAWLAISTLSGSLAPGEETTVVVNLTSDADALAPGNYSATVLFNDQSRTVTLAVTGVVPPSNDDLAAATLITGSSIAVTGDNAGADKQPGEPNHADNSGGRSVWWRWVAPRDLAVVVDTFGSSFDTTLGVYQGDNVANLAQIAANDDAGSDLQSRVNFQASSGAVYFIAVDGFNAAFGDIRLQLEAGLPPPPNDDFSNAGPLFGDNGSIDVSNVGAGHESGEPTAHAADGGASVWWFWTPSVSGNARVDTLGSLIDTVLAVYTGDSLAGLELVAVNDDSEVSGQPVAQSAVTFPAVAGTTYYIVVDGHNGASGAIRLNYVVEDAPGRVFRDGFE